MNKKNYFIIGATILIFIIAIAIILGLGNGTNKNWTTDIIKSQNYQIIMKDCNGREKTLDNKIINTLSDKWNNLSNNGPWTGDTNTCYTTLTFNYENNGIINSKEILLIDETSLTLIVGNNTIYYTKASEVINYLNTLFAA